MNENQDLEEEIQNLWDDAIVMLDTDFIDRQQAAELHQKLVDCAARADSADLIGGARQLSRAAADLVARCGSF